VGNGHITAVQGDFHLVASLADDDDTAFRADPVDPVEEMEKQRPGGDRVKDLVRVGAHPGALPGGENHDCEISYLRHFDAA
jgi:hypothetical protein